MTLHGTHFDGINDAAIIPCQMYILGNACLRDTVLFEYNGIKGCRHQRVKQSNSQTDRQV